MTGYPQSFEVAAEQVRVPNLCTTIFSLAICNITIVCTKRFTKTELLLGDATVGGRAEEIILKTAAEAGSRDWGAEAGLAVDRQTLAIPAVWGAGRGAADLSSPVTIAAVCGGIDHCLSYITGGLTARG